MLKPKDRQLIDLLRQNARMSVSSLSRSLGVSRSTVQDRLTRLEAEGVIAGYTVQLGDHMEAQRVRAIVMLKIAPHAQDEIVAACRRMQSVASLFTVAGEYDLAAVVSADSTGQLDEALDALGRQKGIERTQSSVILSRKFERPD